uniref:Metallophos domain-containing protein n=1 Tax=Gongylonema pulchrum TaxID=637853 RepID=A0A183D5N4_9BILA
LTEDMREATLDDERSSPVGAALEVFRRRSSQRCRVSRSHSSRRKRNSTEISPHKYTNDPLLAWEMLKNNRPVKPVRQMKLNTPVKRDAVRFVCMSCLHQSFPDPQSVPPGDVLIIAGDFTLCGRPDEIELFDNYTRQLKHVFKIVIAGNHECTFDDRFMKATGKDLSEKEFAIKQTLSDSFSVHEVKNAKQNLKNCIYLEDSSVELFGLQIYGTPWLVITLK